MDSNVVKKGGNDEDRTSGDCISRQMAIDALKEKVFHNLSDEFYGAMQVLDELPSAQPERKTGRWIPVSERLPDEKGEYLVTYHPCYWDDVEDEIKVGIDSFRGKTAWAKKKYQRVIAWMPLPEPYQGGEQK